MRVLLPHPLLSAGLLVMWLLMNQTLQPGPALVGALVALLGGWALALLRPGRSRLRRPGTILRLAGQVAVDVVRSNIGVAKVILLRRPDRRSGFIRVRLTLRDPQALAVLAVILTATPGTAWLEFDAGEGWLLLHVLDLIDEADWTRIIRDHYERPLLEIFR
ncbi:Na+/H+ antiporter subunit E [Paeniroseomonas aquatica]|uniref:Na+/H+ antiporter subunit E n=1 Tax=Paeniroseomonas aquatica TaxID=373043 RepID=A0ABT8ACF2_9PROT|nr:Na+/H+ antiporter subunit E [Paeniroseomonas aquatica]MDN3567405.1 Na+/H+ antiporter subunit E [Paeniroseomonas aquatica]